MTRVTTLESESDSDCSVKSEDVLKCDYPVKPRKTRNFNEKATLKRQQQYMLQQQMQEQQNDQNESMDVDACLRYIDSLTRTKKHFFDAECEREKLDNKSQVCELG